MQLFFKSETLEIENPEVANLFFEAFKLGRSFAKTSAIIIANLNKQKETLKQYLSEYEQAYNSVKDDICLAIDENPNHLYSTFLKHSNELSNKINHINFLEFETFQTFSKNQEQIFENFIANPNMRGDKYKAIIKSDAKEILSLHDKFSKTQEILSDALEAEPITLDDVSFVEQKIAEAKQKLATFPFSVEEDYSKLISFAKTINQMELELSESQENSK